MTGNMARRVGGASLTAMAAALLMPGLATAQASNAPPQNVNPSDVQPGQEQPDQTQQTAAQAPVADPAGEAQPAGEDVIVTGFRGSLAKALNQKRTEAASVDSILAEDIGKFPDLNLSESIQRIPGVALARDGGEGRQISVRGLGPQFTRVRINGLEALTTAGGADSSGGTNRGRAFDFNVFASDLFNAITVRKTAEPSTEEGSLGATVDLRTARPFDYKKLTIAASAQADYGDLRQKVTPRGALMIADSTEDGRFGALISVAYTKRQIEEEGFSTVRWAQGRNFAPGFEGALGSTCVPANANGTSGTAISPAPANCADANSALHPRFPRYDQYLTNQERLGITGSIQFAPTDSTLISIDGLYADFKGTREERYLEAPSFSVAGACTAASRLTNCGIADTSVTAATYTPTGGSGTTAPNILTKGTFDDVDLRVENRFDRLDTKFKQLTAEVTQKFGDHVTLEVLGGISQSSFRNPVQNTLTFDQFNVDGYSYDYTDPRNPVFGFGTAKLTDSTAWTLSQVRLRAATAKNDFKTIQGNLTWKVNDEFSILAGAEYKAYEFRTTELRRSNGTASSLDTTIPAALAAVPLASYGQVVTLGPTSVFIPNYFAGDKQFNFGSQTAYNGAFRLGPEPALTSNSSVSEDDSAGYLQFNWNRRYGDITVRGNGGLRYVHTGQTANGFAILNGVVTPNVATRGYDDYLPSINLVIEPTSNVVIRFAAAQVMARPDLGSLPPGGSVTVSGANRSVSFGNPNLDPYRADAYDAAFEWYFQPGALLSVALFDKYIKSFVTNATQAGQTFSGNPYGLPDSVAIAACGNLYPATCNPNQNNWSFTVPLNSPGGTLKGFELNFQMPFRFLPGPLKNLGVLLNYTHVTSDIKYVNAQRVVVARGNLTGLSPDSGNATLYYEDKLISARVSGAYRSAYLTRIPGQEAGTLTEGTNRTINLDTSVQVNLTSQIKLTFEGINLTDQYQDQYIDPGNLMVTYHHTGREFLAGIRFNL
jgi:iron complex outermembrane receptor protein